MVPGTIWKATQVRLQISARGSEVALGASLPCRAEVIFRPGVREDHVAGDSKQRHHDPKQQELPGSMRQKAKRCGESAIRAASGCALHVKLGRWLICIQDRSGGWGLRSGLRHNT